MDFIINLKHVKIIDFMIHPAYLVGKYKWLTVFALSLTAMLEGLIELLKLDNMIIELTGIIFFLVIGDAITGMSASKHRGEIIITRRGFKMVWKLIVYFVLMYIMMQLRINPLFATTPFLEGVMAYMEMTLLILIILWEFESWGENLEVLLGYKPRIFGFMNKIATIFEALITKMAIKKVEEVDEKVKEITDFESDKE